MVPHKLHAPTLAGDLGTMRTFSIVLLPHNVRTDYLTPTRRGSLGTVGFCFCSGGSVRRVIRNLTVISNTPCMRVVNERRLHRGKASRDLEAMLKSMVVV